MSNQKQNQHWNAGAKEIQQLNPDGPDQDHQAPVSFIKSLGDLRFNPWVWPHIFCRDFGHEIICAVVLSITLIQIRQLST